MKTTYQVLLGGLVVLYCAFVSCNKPSAVEFDAKFIRPHTSGSDMHDTSIYLNILSQGTATDQDTFVVLSRAHFAPIGIISTSQYGTVKASSFMQYKPSSFPVTLKGKNRTLDSAIFLLRCSYFEGDTLAPNAIEIYEVDDNDFAQRKKRRFQNNNIGVKPTLLGSYAKTFHEFRLDETKDHVSTYKYSIKIHLDDSWGEKFLLQDNTTGIKSDSLYNVFSNGFALIPNESARSNMFHCNLQDTSSRLIVYYKFEDDNGKKDTTYIKLSTTTLSTFATEVTRERTGSDADIALARQSAIKEFYLQPPPSGSHVILEPPNLEFLPDNSIISKAEIIMEHKPFSLFNTAFSYPQQLYLDVLDDGKELRRPIPLLLAAPSVSYTFFPSTFGYAYLDGYYNDNKIKDFKGYRINFTRYAQAMVTGAQHPKNFKIWAPYFIAYNNSSTEKISVLYSSNRRLLAQSGIRLYGSDPKEKKSLRLRIVYTK